MKSKTGTSGKGKRTATKSELRIAKDLVRRLRREAEALRLDVSEYVALIIHGSEVIRQSLLPEGIEDATVLRKVLRTPLLLDLVKTTARSVIRNTVGEHLPDWRSKDMSPEHLINWLRELGAKKPAPDTPPLPGRFPRPPAQPAPIPEQARTFPAVPPIYDLPWPPPEMLAYGSRPHRR